MSTPFKKKDIQKAARILKKLEAKATEKPCCYGFCRCNDSCKPCEWAWPCYFATWDGVVMSARLDGII